MRGALWPVTLAAVLLTLAGCTPTSADRVNAARPGRSPTTASPIGSTAAGHVNGSFTLAFAGDVHFTGRTRARLDRDPSTAIGPMSRKLAAADLAMVNLETSITDRGAPEPKSYRFRAPATAFSALRAAGIDVVTMANNHGLDYGPVGLADSLAAIRASGFPTVGLGSDAEAAFAPYRVSVRGRRVAILAGTSIIDTRLRPTWTATANRPGLASAIMPDRLVAAVRAARTTADVVVVYVHWGQERNPCPIPAQRSLAARLVAAGADVLVGTHAHTLLGAGYLGPAYVSYGLGNFLWYTSNRASADATGVLSLTMTGRRVTAVSWSPARVSASGAPEPVSGAATEQARQRWARLRSCTNLAGSPQP